MLMGFLQISDFGFRILASPYYKVKASDVGYVM